MHPGGWCRNGHSHNSAARGFFPPFDREFLVHECQSCENWSKNSDSPCSSLRARTSARLEGLRHGGGGWRSDCIGSGGNFRTCGVVRGTRRAWGRTLVFGWFTRAWSAPSQRWLRETVGHSRADFAPRQNRLRETHGPGSQVAPREGRQE